MTETKSKKSPRVSDFVGNGQDGENASPSERIAKGKEVTISPPNIQTATFCIVGTSKFVQNKFSKKARDQMKAKQEAGSTGTKGKKRDAKDFEAACEDAKHISADGWCGIPAPAFRNAMIDACRLVNFKMTHAKLSIFCKADGYDADDGTPLVKITKGEPYYSEMPVRNETGVCDLRPRPMWDEGWEAEVTLQFDGDQFTLDDVTNLLHRVGVQVGVGEGRHNSKKSPGMGWGTFRIKTRDES